MLKRRLAVVLAGSALCVVAGASPAGAATLQKTFTTSIDSYVSSSNPSTNYGNSTSVTLAAAGDVRRGYMRFTVSGLTGSIDSVALRVYANTSHASGFNVRGVSSTSWGEGSITNGNAPAMSSTVAGTTGAVTGGGFVTVPLTGIVTGNGTYSIGLLANGSSTSTLSLQSSDAANAPQLVIQTSDTTAPSLTMANPPAGSQTDRTTTYSGTKGTASGDSTTVNVSVFSGSSATGTPVQTLSDTRTGSTWTVTGSTLADGTYTGRATQSDEHGNTTTQLRTYTIDNVAPAVTITAPAASAVLPSATPTITGTGGSAFGDDATVSLNVYSGSSASGTPVQTIVVPTSGGAWSVNTAVLADGTYTVRANQRDGAGNSTNSNTRTFRVDTVFPTVAVTQPTAGQWLTSGAVLVRGTATNATGDATSVTVRVYAGATATGTPVFTSTPTVSSGIWQSTTSALAEGAYTVQTQQTDTASHVALSAARTFNVDLNAPAVTLTTPAASAVVGSATPQLAGSGGTASGDDATVTVEIFSGSTATGTPVQTIVAPVSAGAWTTNAAALADGTYTARARQSDAAGRSTTSNTRTFRVDTTAPSTAVTQPTSGQMLGAAAALVRGTASSGLGDATSVTVRVYGGGTATGIPAFSASAPVSAGAWQATTSALADGTYTAQAEQADSAGNLGLSSAVTFSVDTTAPVVSLAVPVSGSLLASATPLLSGGAGTAAGDGSTVSVNIHDGSSTAGTLVQTIVAPVSAGAWSATAASLADGTYTAVAHQLDSVGNSGTSSTSTFTIDSAAPVVSITTPVSGSYVASATPAISGAAGGASGDDASVSIDVYSGGSASGSPIQTLSAPVSGGAWSTSPATLTDGTYTAVARQSDAGGNDATSASSSFTVDTAAPVVSVSAPADGAQLDDSTPALSGSGGAASGDASTVTVELFSGSSAAGSPLQTIAAPVSAGDWSVSATSLADGTYTVRALQTDAAGNTGTSGSSTFTVSVPGPDVAVTQPTAGQVLAHQPVALGGTASSEPGDAPSVTVRVYSGSAASGSPELTQSAPITGGAWQVTTSALADGTHTVQTTHTDDTDHTTLSVPITFSLDTTAPSVSVSSPAAGAALGTATPALSGSGGSAAGDDSTVTVELYSGSSASGSPAQTIVSAVSGGAWSTTPAALSDGTYTVRATQLDDAGNTGTSNARTFTVDTTAPSIALTAPAAGTSLSTSTPAITGTAGSAASDSTVTVELFSGSSASGSPAQTLSATVSGDGTFSATPSSLADGTYTIRASQSDAAGNSSTAAPRTFSVDTSAPSVTLGAPAAGALFATATPAISGTGSSAPGDDSTVSIELFSGSSASGSPAQTIVAAISGGIWSTSPAALADGTYTVRARQLDAAGNSALSGARTFSIDTTAPSVTVTAPTAGQAVAQSAVALAGTASSASGDASAVTVRVYSGGTASGSPVFSSSASISSGTWQVTTGTLADGGYTAQVQHTDDAGNSSLSTPVSFTVATATDNTPPAVAVTQPTSLQTIGGTIPLAGTAGNAATDDATVTIKVYGDPSQAPVRSVTTTRTGTAWSTSTAALPTGTYTVKAEQSDAAGNTGVSPGIVFKAGNTYPQEIQADGPRAFWRLGEASGTTAADLGSASNLGTYTGGVLLARPGALPGDTDTAVQFDGVNDNVNFGDPANDSLELGTADFSIELWMKTGLNNSQSVIGKQGSSGAYWQLLVTNAASQLGKLRATFNDGSTTRQLFSSARVDDNAWHHVLVSFKRSTGVDMYVDGAKTSLTGALTGSLSNTAALQIGKVTGFPYYTGLIDDVAIYPSALSQTRVNAHIVASQGPDVAAPSPTITGPATPTDDVRPTFTGKISTTPGDSSQVTLKIYSGSTATGSALQTRTTTATENNVWSSNAASALSNGTYTATVTQSDNVGNVGTASRTFVVSAPTAPPDYRAAVLASGPRAYWRLGEGSGVATGDETNGDNAGAILGGAAFNATGAIAGDNDRSMLFDGVDDEVNAGDPANGTLDLGTNDVTIEGWLKTSSHAYQSLITKQGTSGTGGWQLAILDGTEWGGQLRATFSNGSTSRQGFGHQRIDDGNWHYFAVTYRRNTGIDFYVDGFQNYLPGTLSGSLDNSTQLRIGRQTGFPSFAGSLDDVAVYDRALSTSEIDAHFAEGTRAKSAAPTVSLTVPSNGSTSADATPQFAGATANGRGDLPKISVKVYAGSDTSGSLVRTSQVIADRAGNWSVEDGTPLSPGTYTARAEQTDTAGRVGQSSAVTFTIGAPPAPNNDPALITAGDIASCGSLFGDENTAALLGQLSGEIQTIGDNAYDHGSTADFACFNSSWGQYKSRIHPSLGDHEYDNGNANPYFAYFGAAAGTSPGGYYSYDVGSWHIVVTNPVCDQVPGGCDAGSPQEQWLRADLAANPRQCTIGVVGGARFSSGGVHGNESEVKDLWRALYDAGADVVLTADDHDYERYSPITPEGLSDLSRGMREFVVGTGGYYLYELGTQQPLSEELKGGQHGVLRLQLHSGSYDWQFHSVAGSTYTDIGSASCH